jgi:hypothetical protein
MEYIFRVPRMSHAMIISSSSNTENSTNIEPPIQEPRPRRKVTCSLCFKMGHNIRSCNLFESTKKEGIAIYKKFLYHTIVGFTQNWDYANMEPEESQYNIASDETLERFATYRNDPDAIEKILDTPLLWIQQLNDVCLRGLIYGFTIDRKAPMAEIRSQLHYIFISEADDKWMKSHDTTRCIPYLTHSIQYLPILEAVNSKIFQYNHIQNVTRVISTLYDVPYRNERIQIIYNQNRRLIRMHSSDTQRYNRILQDLEIRLQRLQNETSRVRQMYEESVQRRDDFVRDLELFPETIRRKPITILQAQEGKHPFVSIECPICYSDVESSNIVYLDCKHTYCVQCILHTLLQKYNPFNTDLNCACPLCREKIKTLYGDNDLIKRRLDSLVQTQNHLREVYDVIG